MINNPTIQHFVSDFNCTHQPYCNNRWHHITRLFKTHVPAFFSKVAKKIRGFCRQVRDLVSYSAVTTADFIKKHPIAFAAYSLSAIGMIACGATLAQASVAILPGLCYILFQPGNTLPQEMIKHVEADAFHEKWIPQGKKILTNESLEARRLVSNKVINTLKTPANQHSNGWSLVHGPSGIGKSSFLLATARELASQGHKVFILDTTKLEGGQLMESLEQRFTNLALHLNRIAAEEDKSVILLIDEFHRIVKPHCPGFNDFLKDTAAFPLCFNILATTTTHDLKNIELIDDALLRRFDGKSHEIKGLDKLAIIQTLKKIKEDAFERPNQIRLNDEVIQFAVEQAECSIQSPDKLFTRANTLISLSCFTAAEEGRAEPTEEDVINTIQGLLSL